MSTKKISEIESKATSAEIGNAKLVAAIPSGNEHVTKYIKGSDLTSSIASQVTIPDSSIPVTFAQESSWPTGAPNSSTLTSISCYNPGGNVAKTSMTFNFANGISLAVSTTSVNW